MCVQYCNIFNIYCRSLFIYFFNLWDKNHLIIPYASIAYLFFSMTIKYKSVNVFIRYMLVIYTYHKTRKSLSRKLTQRQRDGESTLIMYSPTFCFSVIAFMNPLSCLSPGCCGLGSWRLWELQHELIITEDRTRFSLRKQSDPNTPPDPDKHFL